MLDFVYFVKIIQNIKLSKFSTIFYRETSQAPTPSPPNVHMTFCPRGQNRYVTPPLTRVEISKFKPETVEKNIVKYRSSAESELTPLRCR